MKSQIGSHEKEALCSVLGIACEIVEVHFAPEDPGYELLVAHVFDALLAQPKVKHDTPPAAPEQEAQTT